MTRAGNWFLVAAFAAVWFGCGSNDGLSGTGGSGGTAGASGKGGSAGQGVAGSHGGGAGASGGAGAVGGSVGGGVASGYAGSAGGAGAGGSVGYAGAGGGVGYAGAGGGGGHAGSGETLTCDFLVSNNCWDKLVAATISCQADPTVVGRFSADGSTCTYASGHVVAFTPPLVPPLPTNGSVTWNFTVTTPGGATCLAYTDDGKGDVALTVQGQTARATNKKGLGISVTCPDGTTYSNAKGLDPQSCDSVLYANPPLPGASWSQAPISTGGYGVALSLDATASLAPDGTWLGANVFSCEP